jgi:RHH-type rel operon transcriptional repressor/antitoxin RelB
MLAIRISKEIEERLERLAKKTGRTKTFYAREAILEHIEDLEDYYLAAEVLARVRHGQTGQCSDPPDIEFFAWAACKSRQPTLIAQSADRATGRFLEIPYGRLQGGLRYPGSADHDIGGSRTTSQQSVSLIKESAWKQ